MSSPIVIRGASNFSSILTKQFKLEGARTIVTGLQFAGPDARIYVGGTNNKVIANRFTDWRSYAITPSTGRQGEIAYNELYKPHPWLASEVGTYPYRAGIRTNEKDASTFHYDAWVHHNYFRDFPEKPDPNNYRSGQSDAIELCQTNRDWTYRSPSGWYIERNLIRNHMQGHGVVDIKCSGTVVRFNTITESPVGRIDLRYGSRSTIESNWLENGGSTVHGGYHRIVGNYMRNGPGIILKSGDLDWDDGSRTGHNRAFDVLVAGNDVNSMAIGVADNEATRAYPALDNVVEGNNGTSPRLSVETNTTIRASTDVRIAAPFKLSIGDVGPSALGQAPASYLHCRVP